MMFFVPAGAPAHPLVTEYAVLLPLNPVSVFHTETAIQSRVRAALGSVGWLRGGAKRPPSLSRPSLIPSAPDTKPEYPILILGENTIGAWAWRRPAAYSKPPH